MCLSLASMARIVRLNKRDGKVGIRLGGGAPCYPLVFVAEVVPGSPADENGQLTAGDELLAINNENLHGSGRAYAARLIRQSAVRQAETGPQTVGLSCDTHLCIFFACFTKNNKL